MGEPGIGKSTILAKYVSEKPCIAYFNIRSSGRNTAGQFLESVCTQLISNYDLGYSSLPVNATENGNLLEDLLQKVSNQLSPSKRLVIAVDALDEVNKKSQKEGTNLCYLPRYLPPNVYFLLTRRPFIPEEERLLTESPKLDFYLWKYSKQSEEDVKEYIQLFLVDPEFEESLRQWIVDRSLSNEEFIAQLADKSQNNFMYLRYVLPAIAKGFYQKWDLRGLPQGLRAYYEDQWQRMGMMTEQQRHKVIIICFFVELALPVSCELIADISEQDIDEVQKVLDEWIEFFSEDELEEQICYSIYHSSFVDFLDDKLKQKRLTVTRQEINARIANYLEQEMEEDE